MLVLVLAVLSVVLNAISISRSTSYFTLFLPNLNLRPARRSVRSWRMLLSARRRPCAATVRRGREGGGGNRKGRDAGERDCLGQIQTKKYISMFVFAFAHDCGITVEACIARCYRGARDCVSGKVLFTGYWPIKQNVGLEKKIWERRKKDGKRKKRKNVLYCLTLEPTTFNQNHQKNKKTANSHVHTLARISFL